MKINCDIGERGYDNKIDIQLMEHIDIANIACGGHAGDIRSIDTFRELADKYKIQTSAHLSYPDKLNFGRTSNFCNIDILMESLDEQYSLVCDMDTIKFHGALYNDLCNNVTLATSISNWLSDNNIKKLICPINSEIANVLYDHKSIKIIGEAFAERNYLYEPTKNILSLVDRKMSYASIHNLLDAVDHSMLIMGGYVNAYTDGADHIRSKIKLECDTICIHSDSDIALDLSIELRKLISC